MPRRIGTLKRASGALQGSSALQAGDASFVSSGQDLADRLKVREQLRKQFFKRDSGSRVPQRLSPAQVSTGQPLRQVAPPAQPIMTRQIRRKPVRRPVVSRENIPVRRRGRRRFF